MKRGRRSWVLIALLCTFAVAAGVRAAWLTAETVALNHRIEDARMALGSGPPEPSAPREVLAPFATWSEFIAQLDRAIRATDIEQVEYHTTGARQVEQPGVHPVAREEAEQPYEDSISSRSEPVEETFGVDLEDGIEGQRAPVVYPYRALSVRLRGMGSYAEIAEFTAELANGEPALTLDRISLSAASPHPRFEAWIHLDSALPIETLEEGLFDLATRPTSEEPS